MTSHTRLRVALGAATVLAIALLMPAIAGGATGRALEALVSGSIGSWYAFGSGTLVRATPLMLTGLAVAIAFRAGVFNIGAEGQFILGASAAAAAALALPNVPRFLLVPLVLLAAAAAGAGWAATAGLLRVRFQVLEVISTIMLNFVALYLVSYIVRGPLQEPTRVFPQTPTLPDASRLPHLGPTTRLHAGFLIATIACLAAAWIVRQTAAGFRLRAVGANPLAARSAGLIDVDRVLFRTFLISGAIAGLAGGIEVSGVTYALYENISPGYGYTAIAVALAARLDPAAVIATGILFGALESGAAAMQRDAGIPSVMVTAAEAAIILLLLVAGRIRFSAPRAAA